MIHFDLPKEKSSIIKVIGVGGGGSNAVNYMFNQSIEGVNFIICNTDAQAIAQSKVPNKIQLGPHLTQGLGAGANPDIGRQATEESLEEIKRILEVNTKMAFITAGMGGGTGTGGAPIISKICKELGILTVGIVTTPFSYEGRKRQIQAEEGIKVLKQYVDTLLVISNDKLRHQFGNLKMKEAFAKADNVLATAAKCITDVINSTGQINVDFADVCTVMRNGGVAILGSAIAQGENRAQKVIEEALNSPLLNDNEIRGAKWILININSAEGEHEFTMDEVDIIQNYLLSQAGEGTDVILGLGYDNTLENNIGITIIATGFEYSDPFDKNEENPAQANKEEKIVMKLEMKKEDTAPVISLNYTEQADPPVFHTVKEEDEQEVKEQTPTEEPALPESLQPRLIEIDMVRPSSPLVLFSDYEDDRKDQEKKKEDITNPEQLLFNNSISKTNSPSTAASGGYLAKPFNIYAEPESVRPEQSNPEHTPVKEPISNTGDKKIQEEDSSHGDLHLVFKDDIPAAEEPGAYQTPISVMESPSAEEPAPQDEAEDQRRRAAERIQKLRNLSFNINTADPNNEFETVPAYVRRNLELYNTINNVEDFYSKYEVRKDENEQTRISTINTFLDGKKPD